MKNERILSFLFYMTYNFRFKYGTHESLLDEVMTYFQLRKNNGSIREMGGQICTCLDERVEDNMKL